MVIEISHLGTVIEAWGPRKFKTSHWAAPASANQPCRAPLFPASLLLWVRLWIENPRQNLTVLEKLIFIFSMV